jgi:hypothetical protein
VGVFPLRMEWTPWMAPLTPITVPRMATKIAVERFLKLVGDPLSLVVFTWPSATSLFYPFGRSLVVLRSSTQLYRVRLTASR